MGSSNARAGLAWAANFCLPWPLLYPWHRSVRFERRIPTALFRPLLPELVTLRSLALPNIDEDKTFAVEIAHEENALTAPTCCMQAALLYTTSSGERRIRVHTVQLPVTSGLNALFDAADVDACANLLGRMAIDTAMCAHALP